jgi:SAM-dependent methyltransferase
VTSGWVSNRDAWSPLGAALLDFHRGNHSAEVTITSDLWEDEPTPVAAFYRPAEQPLPELHSRALALCRGRVLDLGAGAGRHALELQSAGHDVVAVDVLPEAVGIMRDRGVADARCGDLTAAEEDRFDTIIMLMHGIGVVGDIHGLGLLLERLPTILRPGGRLICDSADLAAVLERESPELFDELTAPRSYVGEVAFGLRYGDLVGSNYPWLFIDPDRLAIIAGAAGFDVEVAARGDRGSYLAVLQQSPAA